MIIRNIEYACNEEIKNLKKEIMNTYFEIGGKIEERAVSYAPADLGGLRGSSATLRNDKGNFVIVQFSAEYALPVHEMVPKHAGEKRKGIHSKGNYWDNGQPHYLERAVNELEPALETAVNRINS